MAASWALEYKQAARHRILLRTYDLLLQVLDFQPNRLLWEGPRSVSWPQGDAAKRLKQTAESCELQSMTSGSSGLHCFCLSLLGRGFGPQLHVHLQTRRNAAA